MAIHNTRPLSAGSWPRRGELFRRRRDQNETHARLQLQALVHEPGNPGFHHSELIWTCFGWAERSMPGHFWVLRHIPNSTSDKHEMNQWDHYTDYEQASQVPDPLIPSEPRPPAPEQKLEPLCYGIGLISIGVDKASTYTHIKYLISEWQGHIVTTS